MCVFRGDFYYYLLYPTKPSPLVECFCIQFFLFHYYYYYNYKFMYYEFMNANFFSYFCFAFQVTIVMQKRTKQNKNISHQEVKGIVFLFLL